MQYEEHFEIHTRQRGGETVVKRLNTASAAEAEELWSAMTVGQQAGTSVQLVRVGTVIIASSSRA